VAKMMFADPARQVSRRRTRCSCADLEARSAPPFAGRRTPSKSRRAPSALARRATARPPSPLGRFTLFNLPRPHRRRETGARQAARQALGIEFILFDIREYGERHTVSGRGSSARARPGLRRLRLRAASSPTRSPIPRPSCSSRRDGRRIPTSSRATPGDDHGHPHPTTRQARRFPPPRPSSYDVNGRAAGARHGKLVGLRASAAKAGEDRPSRSRTLQAQPPYSETGSTVLVSFSRPLYPSTRR